MREGSGRVRWVCHALCSASTSPCERHATCSVQSPLFLCHSSSLPATASCAAGGKFHFNVVKRLLALHVNGGLSQHIPHRVTESFMLHRIPHAPLPSTAHDKTQLKRHLNHANFSYCVSKTLHWNSLATHLAPQFLLSSPWVLFGNC